MMGNKQKLKKGDEYDVVYARKRYCYLVNRCHKVRDVKKRLSKRRRTEGKIDLDKEWQ